MVKFKKKITVGKGKVGRKRPLVRRAGKPGRRKLSLQEGKPVKVSLTPD